MLSPEMFGFDDEEVINVFEIDYANERGKEMAVFKEYYGEKLSAAMSMAEFTTTADVFVHITSLIALVNLDSEHHQIERSKADIARSFETYVNKQDLSEIFEWDLDGSLFRGVEGFNSHSSTKFLARLPLLYCAKHTLNDKYRAGFQNLEENDRLKVFCRDWILRNPSNKYDGKGMYGKDFLTGIMYMALLLSDRKDEFGINDGDEELVTKFTQEMEARESMLKSVLGVGEICISDAYLTAVILFYLRGLVAMKVCLPKHFQQYQIYPGLQDVLAEELDKELRTFTSGKLPDPIHPRDYVEILHDLKLIYGDFDINKGKIVLKEGLDKDRRVLSIPQIRRF